MTRVSLRATLCALAAGLVLSAGAQEITGQTLANLQAAFNGESNASAKYALFATRADEEGYPAVAALFRAASRAEAVHANNHAVVITALGGSAEASLETPTVGTTAENLQAAITGESYERDTMYPGFIETANAEGQADAAQSFGYALTAETEHARLYQAMLDNLEGAGRAAAAPWYVCNVCGWTTSALPESCPSCGNPPDVYEEIA